MLFRIRRVLILLTILFVIVSARCKKSRRSGNDCAERPENPNSVTKPAPSVSKTKRKNKCCPYEFDSTNCKNIDDRVLCGFDKNANWPESKNEVKELSQGCRLRNGRLECGYVEPPYIYKRRPPAWDKVNQLDEDAENVQDSPYYVDNPEVPSIERNGDINIEDNIEKLRFIHKTSGRSCQVVGNRLVCTDRTGQDATVEDKIERLNLIHKESGRNCKVVGNRLVCTDKVGQDATVDDKIKRLSLTKKESERNCKVVGKRLVCTDKVVQDATVR